MTEFVPDSYYPIDIATCPGTWELAVVGDVVADIQPGFASGKHNQLGIGIPHLRPMNIDRLGQIDLTVVKYVSREDGPRLRLDDVLFNNTNSPQLIGKTAWIGQDADWAFSNHMTRLRMPEGLVPKFVAYQLHYLWMTGYFLHRCVKHVNQASISSAPLGQTVALVLPPLPEQRRIVAEIEKQFTRLDAAETALKRVEANLKRYRASVLKAAGEGKLVPTEAELAEAEGRDYEPADQLLERILAERRFRWEAQGKKRGKYKEPATPDVSNLPQLPEGWAYATVEEVIIRSEYGTSVKCNYAADGVPVLRIPNIVAGDIDLFDIKYATQPVPREAQSALQVGDVLMCRTNGSVSLVGRTAVVRTEFGVFHSFASYLLRFRFAETQVLPQWFHTIANSQLGRSIIELNAASSAGQHNVNLKLIHGMIIPLPPLAEQRRIVAEVERKLSVIQQAEATVEASLKRVGRLRQSILKRAFSGQLVPQDPDDGPASVLLERIRAEREAAQAAATDGGRKTRRRRSKAASVKQLRLLENGP